MGAVTFDELSVIREKHPGQKIVFCSGAFDLTHAGHVLFFEDCKKHGKVLVVGISSGSSSSGLKKQKGSGRPILNQHLRLKMVDSLKPVDYTFIVPPIEVSYSLEKVKYIMEKLKPDVYVINSDASDIPYRQQICKNMGIELIILERWCPIEFEQISTTKIIEKIKAA